VDNQRLGHGNAIARPQDRLLAPAALDDPYIGDDVAVLSFLGLDEYSLIHPRSQITGQDLLKGIA
jgi:hypothetical protein